MKRETYVKVILIAGMVAGLFLTVVGLSQFCFLPDCAGFDWTLPSVGIALFLISAIGLSWAFWLFQNRPQSVNREDSDE